MLQLFFYNKNCFCPIIHIILYDLIKEYFRKSKWNLRQLCININKILSITRGRPLMQRPSKYCVVLCGYRQAYNISSVSSLHLLNQTIQIFINVKHNISDNIDVVIIILYKIRQLNYSKETNILINCFRIYQYYK